MFIFSRIQSSYDGENNKPNRFDVNSEIQFSQNSIFINGSSESNMFDVNSDSRCSQGNSNSPPLEIVQTVGNASFASTEDEQSYGEMSVSHMSFDENGVTCNSPLLQQRIDEENHHRNQYDSNGPDLFTQLINARNQLTSMRNISLPSKSSLVEDVFQMYRYDDDIYSRSLKSKCIATIFEFAVVLLISSAASRAFTKFLHASITLEPRSAKTRAVSFPIPELAPVINAVFP
ncbi:unnamed protein product [Acanthosepion pharaonis]|uniref:Uncharacterized protein n=1 Tax=Acanthosepion pharaonis TaxID=158019 RepID=A0A812D0D6_ACAPH|nr:unnamed protein product [Sepia pharaonis]